MLPHGRKPREYRLRSPGSKGGTTSIQASNHHGNDPAVNNGLGHGLEGTNERTWCDRIGSTVLWLRDFIPESQHRSERIITSGYDANILWQNYNRPKTPNSEIGDNKRRMDHATKTHGRRFDRNGDPASGWDVDKDSQVISHCWGRQETQPATNSVVAITVIYKDVSYTGQDGVLQDNSQVSLEQVIANSSPNRAACSKSNELVDSLRYRRFHTVMKSFISLAGILGCPTIVSAAAVPTTCNLCSSRSAQIDRALSLNAVLMLPSPPGRQLLQYFVFCSVVLVLVYYQRAEPYMKHSFLVCSGLLGLILVFSGTETMLRFLPLVVLVTLLASWICRLFIKIIGLFRPREVHGESPAAPGFSYQAIDGKETNLT